VRLPHTPWPAPERERRGLPGGSGAGAADRQRLGEVFVDEEGLARRPADVLATPAARGRERARPLPRGERPPAAGLVQRLLLPGFPPSAGEAQPVLAARVSPRKSDAVQVVARPWRLMAVSNVEQQGFRRDVQVDAAPAERCLGTLGFML
jgi:hypothetical protein